MKRAKPIGIEILEGEDGERRVLREFPDGTVEEELLGPKKARRRPRKPPTRANLDRTRKKRF